MTARHIDCMRLPPLSSVLTSSQHSIITGTLSHHLLSRANSSERLLAGWRIPLAVPGPSGYRLVQYPYCLTLHTAGVGPTAELCLRRRALSITSCAFSCCLWRYKHLSCACWREGGKNAAARGLLAGETTATTSAWLETLKRSLPAGSNRTDSRRPKLLHPPSPSRGTNKGSF